MAYLTRSHNLSAQLRKRPIAVPSKGLRKKCALNAAERVANLNTAGRKNVQKDMIAEVLQTAFTVALSTRLSQNKSIKVDVWCNGWTLMEGRLGGMKVVGESWRTPLALTCQRIQVDVGELVVNYQALMFQQRLTLSNTPVGSCLIQLYPEDLGNFVVHPLMQDAVNTAVQGKPFRFDRKTVRFELLPGNNRGKVYFDGFWAKDGRRYRIIMETGVVNTKGGSLLPESNPLVIVAEPLSATESEDESYIAGAKIVGSELQRFFTQIVLDLQGIEIKAPTFVLNTSGMTPVLAAATAAAATANGRPPVASAAAGTANGRPVGGLARAPGGGGGSGGVTLDINLKMRIKSLPPLDMKF